LFPTYDALFHVRCLQNWSMGASTLALSEQLPVLRITLSTHCDTPHPKNKRTCSCKLELRCTNFHIRLQGDQCTSSVSAVLKRSIPEWRPAREDALSPNRQTEGTVWCPHGERTCPLLTSFCQHAAAKGLMPTL
jgi:hypothetical protein